MHATCMHGGVLKRSKHKHNRKRLTARLPAMQDEMSQLLITREERRLKVSTASFLFLSDVRPEL